MKGQRRVKNFSHSDLQLFEYIENYRNFASFTTLKVGDSDKISSGDSSTITFTAKNDMGYGTIVLLVECIRRDS